MKYKALVDRVFEKYPQAQIFLTLFAVQQRNVSLV